MIRNILASIFFLGLLLPVSAQFYSLNLDTQIPAAPITIERTFTGNTPYLRANIYQSGEPVDLTGWAMVFRYSYGQFDTNGMVTINGTTSSNRVDFIGATNIFFKPYDRYYWSISGTDLSGHIKTYGTGRMIQYYDPATSTNLVTMMGSITMDWWTNNVGAQVTSNRLWIAVFETGKVDTVTFNSSGTVWQAQITSNLTNQNATNTVIQNQVTSNLSNQASTNADFEVRITSNETFNTAQGNTNVIYENRITSNEAFNTAQENTNAAFQALHDAQAATNALKVDITTFNATNTLKVDVTTFNATNALKVDVTTFNATNAIIATGKVDVTTFDATNAAVIAALATKLEAGTNRFDEIYVAPYSHLTTNLCTLTDGVYTGEVTSVAFTGTIDSTMGHTYLLGFQKENAFGTSVLTFAGQTLTATAAGSASNYVTSWSATDTNVILTLWGDGSSKANVSNVFVKAFTNGNASIGWNVAVGNKIAIDGQEITSTKVVTWDAAAIAAALWAAVSNQVQTDILANAGVGTTNAANLLSVSNDVNTLNGKTSGWDQAKTDASSWTNNKLSWNDALDLTNNVKWDQASTDGISATTDVGIIQSSTSLWNTGAADASTATNFIGTNTLQSQIDGKVGTNDSDYTNAVALSGSALQSGADGTWTNLSEYNNDLAGLSSNLSDYNNDVPFVTGAVVRAESDPVFTASVAYAISAGDTTLWHQASADGIAATTAVAVIQDSTSLWNQASTDAVSATTDVGVIQNSTSLWNTGATDATSATTDVATLETDFAAHTNNESANILHMNAAEKLLATNSIQGATIVTGAAPAIVTNAGILGITVQPPLDFGVTDSTAYRGDWGAAVSAAVDNVETATNALNTRVGTIEGYDSIVDYGITDAYTKVESDAAYATGTPLYVESYVGTVTGGTVTAGASDTFVVTGPNAAITWDTNAAGGTGSGLPDINYEGDTTTTTGRVYQQINDGTWQAAVHTSEDLCNKYIGISLGTNSTSDGMVVLGAISVTNEDLNIGSNVYVGDTAGFWTQTVPTNDGYIVRAIGFATDTNEIYVTPSPIWLEVGDTIDTNDLVVTSITASNAAVSNLTIAGGSPTNGAVWIATNNAGQGEWKYLTKFSIYLTANVTNAPNVDVLIAFDGTNRYDRNIGSLVGGVWTPGRACWVRVSAGINWVAGTVTDDFAYRIHIVRDGVIIKTLLTRAPGNLIGLSISSSDYCPTATNTYSIYVQAAQTNVIQSGSVWAYFTGEELP